VSEVWDVEKRVDGWMDGVGLGLGIFRIRGAWVVDKVLEWQTLSSPIYSI